MGMCILLPRILMFILFGIVYQYVLGASSSYVVLITLNTLIENKKEGSMIDIWAKHIWIHCEFA